MKTYESTEEFIEDLNNGNFNGTVVIDNDSVVAYIDGEEVFDFDRQGPAGALHDVLAAFNIDVQFA